METNELRRFFEQTFEHHKRVEGLARRTLQEMERMSQVQDQILAAISAADKQLKADKVLIVGQASTISSLSSQLSASQAQVATLQAQLGEKNIQLDDEVDPDSVHAALASLGATVADLGATVSTSAAGDTSIGNTGNDTLSGATLEGVTSRPITASDPLVAEPIAPAQPGDLNPQLGGITAASGSANVAGVNIPSIVDSVATATGAPTLQVQPAVQAHVDATDNGASQDVASNAAAQAAVAAGASVDTSAAIAASIVQAIAPTAGGAPVADSTAGVVPGLQSQGSTLDVSGTVPSADKPADLPATSIGSGTAPAAATIGAPPSPDLAEPTPSGAPVVSATGTAAAPGGASADVAPSAPSATPST